MLTGVAVGVELSSATFADGHGKTATANNGMSIAFTLARRKS